MHTFLKYTPLPIKSTRRDQGATLLEVMIAMVIFAVGMLGLAGLQISGLRDSGNAEKRTEATIIVNDLIERMRANVVAVTAFDYTSINFASINCSTPPTPYCEDSSSGAAATCTSAQMATFDAALAYCLAQQRLPSGSLGITCTDNVGVIQACNATPYRTISVSWVNNNDFGTTTKGLSVLFRP
ncbi:MAG: type IV pilus modification protein PilV [Gammaproteobacteria bacterium]|nr:type IV pilus modification protein PilV [Gammaproteobacteria bacterium]